MPFLIYTTYEHNIYTHSGNRREKLIEKLKAYKGAEVSNVLYGTGDDALYSNHRRELYN